MNSPKNQRGFTLVEIAIVLVIIGLLLGGILKGQELITSARVRNLADQNSGIQAAYYGFIDRYRQVPGDMEAVSASQLIDDVDNGGDGNGRLDDSGGGSDWTESMALWEHLSKSQFLQGAYNGDDEEPTTGNNQAPINAFNGLMVLYPTDDYLDDDTPSERLHLVIGAGIPATVMRELDLKIDDGFPESGVLRQSATSAGTLAGVGQSEDCVTTDDPPLWDVLGDIQGCNAVYLY